MVGWSALCADCAAVLGLGSRRTTRCAHWVRYAQTRAASQSTKRAARADPSPPLLTTPQIAPAGYRPPRRPPGSVIAPRTTTVSAKARPGRWQRACGAPRSAGLVDRARQRAT